MHKYILLFALLFLTNSQEMYQRHYTQKNIGDDIYLIPKGEHTETLIYLHGLGQTARSLLYIFNNHLEGPCLPTTKVVLLTAPTAKVEIKHGWVIPSWYNIKNIDSVINFKYTGLRSVLNFAKEQGFSGLLNLTKIENMVGMEEINTNSEKIRRVINEEIAELGGDSRKVFIGGVSQGSSMALHTGLGFDKPLGGILASAGFLLPFSKIHKANKNVPIFVSHGKADKKVPFFLANLSYWRLNEKAHQLTKVFEDHVGHDVSNTMLLEAKNWFQKLMAKTVKVAV